MESSKHIHKQFDLKDPVLLVGLLIILYFLQGLLYTSGGFLSRSILLIILVCGAWAFVMTALRRQNPTFVVLLILFLLMLAITYVLSPKYVIGTRYEAIGRISTTSQFKNACTFILSFFIGYYISLSKRSNLYNLGLIGIFYLIASIFIFYYFRTMTLLQSEREDIVNNTAYNFVSVIPFIPIFFMTFKRKIWGIASVVLIIIMVMFGAKRGAIACTVISLAFALVYYLHINKFSIKRIILVLLVSVIAYLLIVYLYESSNFLQSRVTRTFESGIGMRSIGYSVLFNSWLHDTNFFQFLFGRGSAATVSVWGNYGHQDWLELLTDNGILGVILYAAIFLSAISYIKKSCANNYIKLAMYLCILTWFLRSMFSMGYTNADGAISMLLFGSLLAYNETLDNYLNIKNRC